MQILRQEPARQGLHLWYTVKFNKGNRPEGGCRAPEAVRRNLKGSDQRASSVLTIPTASASISAIRHFSRSLPTPAANGDQTTQALPASGTTVTWARATMTLRTSTIINVGAKAGCDVDTRRHGRPAQAILLSSWLFSMRGRDVST